MARAGSADWQLPSLALDGYSKTYKPKKPRKLVDQLLNSPLLRLLVLVLAIAGLVYTFQRSDAGPDWVSRRSALEEEPADNLLDEALGAEQARAPGQQQPDAASSEPSRWHVPTRRRDDFNPLLHRMYLDLPALRQPTPYILGGGWQFNRPVFDYAANHPAAKVLSWDRPRVVLFKSFLSPEEVAHLIDASAPHMERSEVLVDVDGPGNTAVDGSRTSYGAWPPIDAEMERIEERIHRLLAVPRQFGEGIYVLRYQSMQQYQGHNDHCMDGWGGRTVADRPCMEFLTRAGGPECGPGHGGASCGDRIATFIIFLKHPGKGGATVFPNAEITKRRMERAKKAIPNDHEWYCQQEQDVLGINPSVGDAVLFWNYSPGNGAGTGSYGNGTARPAAKASTEALHSGCPVLEGEKFIATRWIRSSAFH